MVRAFFFTFAFMFLLSVSGAFAQDAGLSVRVNENEGYSRLVFEADQRPNYTSQEQAGSVTLNFSQAGKISPVSAANLTDFKVQNTDPMSVTLGFPTSSRTRIFAVGNRVVVDIYGDGKQKTEIQNTEEKKSQEPQGPEIAQVEEPKPEPEPEQMLPPTPGLLAQKQTSTVKPAAISFSSTKAQGIAVFLMNNELYVFNDEDNPTLTPQLGGAGAMALGRLQDVQIIGGRGYKVNMPQDAKVRGQGGGLVWRILVSDEIQKEEPTQPGYKDSKVIWPLKDASEVIAFNDPVSGAPMQIVTVKDANAFVGPARDFVDFKTLPSPVGLAIVSKVDDLSVKITKTGVEISRTAGLDLAAEAPQVMRIEQKPQEIVSLDEPKAPQKNIFSFKEWDMGGINALSANAVIMLGDLQKKSDADKTESLVTLAKMFLTNAQGLEALGFLAYASNIVPDLDQNPTFLALKGAAQAIGLRSDEAFETLSSPSLAAYEEIGYWRSFALADLGDWVQAKEVLPSDYADLMRYPPLIFNRLALNLAEVELRSGEVAKAEELLAAVESNKDTLLDPQKAALSYLKGEAARQKGQTDDTYKAWEELITGEDDYYRAKSGLAMTRLMVNEQKLSSQEAIDRLERLRYAWRGDELEAQIYYWLGKTYFENKDYPRALNIMREAAAVAAGTDLGTRIAAEMSQEFTNIFLSDLLKKMSPVEAAALYEQFSELAPVGSEGDKVVEMLAEHLVESDMLDRAASLLNHQLEHRLQGLDAFRVATRLAGIHLINGSPQKAIEVLDKAKTTYESLPEELKTPQRQLEIALLRARALSKQNRPDQALALLKNAERLPSVNRLRADIAWSAAYWDDAAEALEDVIGDENISLTRPLSKDHTALLLNMAVALNLAGDRVGLANMREKYTDAMTQTDKARLFEVVTRPRQSAELASRETLMGVVSEVDLFSDFLNTYRKAGASDQETSSQETKAATNPTSEPLSQ